MLPLMASSRPDAGVADAALTSMQPEHEGGGSGTAHAAAFTTW